ncbi:Fructosamine kinase-domain-containing protein [Xylaria bambusicola]|uniref:Fructosamine kinase-domain-containing protein n=1 Tax=Xylaria bambusicola TaxID=326684 RepID=UPI002007470D|nr:Fructosamine kinase-domain-containing protein [Xylaria bambusicola]KAI0520958.1 Fructosamine kinase-domain-containing protein [Xylaria bambusicola]
MKTVSQTHTPTSPGRSVHYMGDFPVNDNVLAQFPAGTQVRSANRLLKSAWTVTARLDLKLPGGSEQRIFLKSAPGSHGHTLMEGEFNAMSELYKWVPDLVPKPLAFGRYAGTDIEAYFFLSEYTDVQETMPDPSKLCAGLGRVPQYVNWEKSWKAFFIRLLKHEDLEIVENRLISDVVPRLLGALETGGRSIKPSLIHGDLWEGNTGTTREDGNIYIFDSAAFYGHNEMEIGDWRCHYNRIHDKRYTESYLHHYGGPSEPEDEWEDRNRLYSVYFNIIYSVNHLSQGTAVRQVAYNDMCYLVDKFAPFLDGNCPSKLEDSQMATLSKERDHTVGTEQVD